MERRRLLRDIDVAEAMREHLAATSPELNAAMTLLSSVRGRPNVASKSGRAELPRAVVDKKGMVDKDGSVGRERPMATTSGTVLASGSRSLPKSTPRIGGTVSVKRRSGGGDVESDSEHKETEVLVLEDSEVSLGGSSGDESRSRSSGSLYSSGRSRTSRKRTTEDSPEREPRRVGQQPFPGAIGRGIGGCRIYLPTRDMVKCTADDFVPACDEVAHNREEKSEAVPRFDIDTTVGPSSATATPFVIRSTTLNVPVQLRSHANKDDTAIKKVRPISIEESRGANANISELNVATTTATTMNEWGRHGYIVAEIHNLITAMEPP